MLLIENNAAQQPGVKRYCRGLPPLCDVKGSYTAQFEHVSIRPLILI